MTMIQSFDNGALPLQVIRTETMQGGLLAGCDCNERFYR